jgi:adenine phosphoribosyltransferase
MDDFMDRSALADLKNAIRTIPDYPAPRHPVP